MNQKNLNYEIETCPPLNWPQGEVFGELPTMNQKNLNYEIETCHRCVPHVIKESMNQKNLNYEIETYLSSDTGYQLSAYESKESQL